MKISVITVVYNAEKTIRGCIESVISQSYANIEHIVIDGASTDGTQAIVQEYKNTGNVNIFISEKDAGMYDAMNKGIALATGEVVCILNADDFYTDTHSIEYIADAFTDESADCVYGDIEYVHPGDTQKVIRVWKSKRYSEGLFKRGWHPPHTGFFVRKSVYDTYGVYRLDMKTAADYELMLRFLEKEKLNSVYIPRTVVKMRSGGVSNASLLSYIKGDYESMQAWRLNGLYTPWWLLVVKPLRKIPQWIHAKYE